MVSMPEAYSGRQDPGMVSVPGEAHGEGVRGVEGAPPQARTHELEHRKVPMHHVLHHPSVGKRQQICGNAALPPVPSVALFMHIPEDVLVFQHLCFQSGEPGLAEDLLFFPEMHLAVEDQQLKVALDLHLRIRSIEGKFNGIEGAEEGLMLGIEALKP